MADPDTTPDRDDATDRAPEAADQAREPSVRTPRSVAKKGREKRPAVAPGGSAATKATAPAKRAAAGASSPVPGKSAANTPRGKNTAAKGKTTAEKSAMAKRRAAESREVDAGTPESVSEATGEAASKDTAIKGSSDESGQLPGLTIDSHRALIARRQDMLTKLTSDPAASRMLLANPVQAFRDAGVTISPAIADHVLHSVRHPPRVQTERERLTAKLREALQVEPHPSQPGWLAAIVFGQLEVKPLQTDGLEPAYLPLVNPEAEKRLRRLLPPRSRPRKPGIRTPPPARPGVWRLNLETPPPDLPVAAGPPPPELTLPDLWFYRARHDLIPELLRLGIIEVSAIPMLSPATYRRVKNGALTNGLLDWVDEIKFSESAHTQPR